MNLLARQVWTYQTRDGEEDSRITICQVDSHEVVGAIVHIYVSGLRIQLPSAPNGVCEVISHMPYTAAALQDCLIELESTTDELPPYDDGYRQWHEAFVEHKAGVWTAPVAQAIQGMEEALNPQREE